SRSAATVSAFKLRAAGPQDLRVEFYACHGSPASDPLSEAEGNGVRSFFPPIRLQTRTDGNHFLTASSLRRLRGNFLAGWTLRTTPPVTSRSPHGVNRSYGRMPAPP